MKAQRPEFQVVLLVALLFAFKTINGLNIPEGTSNYSKASQKDLEKSDIKNAFVLIGLDNVAKDFRGYGVIPVLEKDIINLFDGNSTLGGSRNFQWKTIEKASRIQTNDPDTQSRLLPLITTPNKALLLFSLHDSLLKSSKNTVSSNCIVITKDDLMDHQEEEPTNPARHHQAHKKEGKTTITNEDE